MSVRRSTEGAVKVISLGTAVATVLATAVPVMSPSHPGVAGAVEALGAVEAQVNAVPAPAVLSATTDPPALGYRGGRTLVTGRVRTSVTTCQLKLLSHQSFPVVYSAHPKRCRVNFHAYIAVGPNPTPVYRSVAFELIARNAAGQFSRGLFFVQLAPYGSSFTAPAPPVVSTAAPPPPTSVPVSQRVSDNWSGYEVSGSNFTSVSGTFTVPRLQTDETCRTVEMQWVGIDGGNPGDSDLIQAGVDEKPYNAFGANTCLAPNRFFIYAFWEILPAYAVLIPTVEVHVGDRVTVHIFETSTAGHWDISIVDDTNGQTFNTDQPYSGRGLSAEWITESATSPSECPGQVDGYDSLCTETGYSPAVSYSSLGYNSSASVSSLRELTMTQHLTDVSTPSVVPDLAHLLANGFTTTYTGR